jgi:rare lipoprotein A
VRINDRGPYAHDRLIDLSRMTARMLGTETQGLGRVRVRYAGRAPLDGNDAHERRFLASQPWANNFAGNFPPGRMSLGATP